jgi:hypothetical protein
MMMMMMMVVVVQYDIDDDNDIDDDDIDIDDDNNYLWGLECTHHSAIYIKDVSYQQSSIEHIISHTTHIIL